MKSFWDERYGEEGYIYGTLPNDFLAAHADRIPAGRVLCLAEGEGRNAVYLAGLGYEVVAVDQSLVGLRKAQALAAAQELSLEIVEADLAEFNIAQGNWAGVVSIWAHVPPAVRAQVHRQVVAGLQDGGVMLLEAYTPRQPEMEGVGGPPATSREMLVTAEGLREELVGLEFELLQEIEREVNEGRYHDGLSSVVQMVGRKGNA